MALSGPEALRLLDEALRDIRREEDDIVRRLGRSTELVTKLRLQEADLFRQLLALRLAQGARAVLDSQISAAEQAAATALDQHTRDLGIAEAALAALDAELARLAGERVQLQGEAAKHDAALRALAATARPQLGADAGYAGKREAAERLAGAARLARQKVAEAEADRAVRGQPYRDDPLFMYLWEKGFGAKTYRANAVVEWFDGRIAALVGYERARANFIALNDIPLRLRDHAGLLQQRADLAAADLAAAESAAVDSVGGSTARSALIQTIDRIAALDRQTAALEDQRDDGLKAERDLAQGSQTAFADAVRRFTNLLGSPELLALVSDARAAPKGQDPTVVQQLDELRQRAKDEDDESREHRARLKTLASRRRDLEDILTEIRTLGMDNPHASFSDDDLAGDALNVFLRGEISVAGYWERFRQSQQWSAAGYGGPAGGWRGPVKSAGSGFGRVRAAARNEGLISAA